MSQELHALNISYRLKWIVVAPRHWNMYTSSLMFISRNESEVHDLVFWGISPVSPAHSGLLEETSAVLEVSLSATRSLLLPPRTSRRRRGWKKCPVASGASQICITKYACICMCIYIYIYLSRYRYIHTPGYPY